MSFEPITQNVNSNPELSNQNKDIMEKSTFNQPPENKKEKIEFELENWKRTEEIKFKAYLRQVEYDYVTKLQEDFKRKEDAREKEFKQKINEINLLKNKLSKKASELESRENKISLCEEQLKLKINEVSKQLVNKDDEIAYITNRFKDEKALLQKEKITLQKNIENLKKQLENVNENFKKYKEEIEDSPISLLKNEINKKQILLEEAEKEKTRLNNEIINARNINDKLKNDLIKMKRAYEEDKENMYKQKMEEIEKLKFEIYNQRESKEELNELKNLKEQIINSTGINGGLTQNYNTVNQNFSSLNYNNANTMQPNNNINLMNASQQSINQQQPKKRLYKILSYSRKEKINEYDAKNEIERLSKERDMLLNGVYQENDPIIVQLENKIKRLLQSSQQDY
jgi:hypothetical protein